MEVEKNAHGLLNVPPPAQAARLLIHRLGWTIQYRWLVADTEGHVEIRRIDSDRLRADDIDPTDVAAVIEHIEHRLQTAGYDVVRRPAEADPVAAGVRLFDGARRSPHRERAQIDPEPTAVFTTAVAGHTDSQGPSIPN